MQRISKRLFCAFLALMLLALAAFPAGAAGITATKAEDIALADANVKRTDAKMYPTGMAYGAYFVSFEVSTKTTVTVYVYSVNASDGRILTKDSQTRSVTVPTPAKTITEDKAVSIALTDAGVSKTAALKLTTVKTTVSGKSVYRVTFYRIKGEKLYRHVYDILVSNGKIINHTVKAVASRPVAVKTLKAAKKTTTTVKLSWTKVTGRSGLSAPAST